MSSLTLEQIEASEDIYLLPFIEARRFFNNGFLKVKKFLKENEATISKDNPIQEIDGYNEHVRLLKAIDKLSPIAMPEYFSLGLKSLELENAVKNMEEGKPSPQFINKTKIKIIELNHVILELQKEKIYKDLTILELSTIATGLIDDKTTENDNIYLLIESFERMLKKAFPENDYKTDEFQNKLIKALDDIECSISCIGDD